MFTAEAPRTGKRRGLTKTRRKRQKTFSHGFTRIVIKSKCQITNRLTNLHTALLAYKKWTVVPHNVIRHYENVNRAGIGIKQVRFALGVRMVKVVA